MEAHFRNLDLQAKVSLPNHTWNVPGCNPYYYIFYSFETVQGSEEVLMMEKYDEGKTYGTIYSVLLILLLW
jgi:hypothetical protein